jgi:transcription elongation GreA/GreB family factor
MLHTAKQIKPPTFWESFRQRFFHRPDQQPRIFSEIDYYRFQGLLTKQHQPAYASQAAYLQQLRQLIHRGYLYPCKAIPPDLVTMNSVLLLRSRRGTAFRVSLVYPPQANHQERKFSILSPLGLAMIGQVEGRQISPHLAIEKILYQPESLGDYYV